MDDVDGDHFDRAAAAHAEGRLDDAAAGYEACLREDPADAVAMALLGAVRTAAGRIDDGVSLLDRAVMLDPSNEIAWLHLGVARQAAGAHEAAIVAFEHARGIRRPFPETVVPLVGALVATRRFEEVHAVSDELGPDDPGWRESRLARIDAAIELGRLEDAETTAREILSRTPDDPDAVARLVAAAMAAPTPADVLERLRRLAEERDRDPRVLSALAHHAGRIGHLDEAERLWNSIAELEPRSIIGRYEQGRVLSVLGRLDEAVRRFEEVLAVEPGHSDTWLALSILKKFRSEDPLLPVLDELEKSIGIRSPPERCNLHFAIARIRDGMGEHDRAFEHLLAASTLHRSAHPSDIENHEGLVGTIISGAPIEAWQSLGRDEPKDGPILVVGMPRSGTTLTEQILARHPDVHGAGELAVAANAINRIGLERILDEVRCADGGVLPPSLTEFADTYLHGIPAPTAPARRVCDKQPQNYQALGVISTAIPSATIVHCVRDPRDVAISCFQAYFGEQPWSFDLRDIGRCLRSHDRLMRHWHACLPGRIVTVRYEDLVSNPQEGIRRLLERAGLPFDERCLHPEQSDHAVNTASIGQVRQPINPRSIGRWRRYERHLGPLLEEIADLLPE